MGGPGGSLYKISYAGPVSGKASLGKGAFQRLFDERRAAESSGKILSMYPGIL